MSDINKVLGRKSYTTKYVVNRLPKAPFKELLIVKDFTGSKHY